ncbi:MAG TPA: Nramp family divalent metal transporter [Byssovorax sp.]|jgi:NRAMP (natural resistance-associated macrophage protein)-like metal ion transporter
MAPETSSRRPHRRAKHRDAARSGRFAWLRVFGPGLLTGASDDDPSGIATYSQAGARYGFGLLWTLLLTFPLMVAIQEVAARVGRVTGHGLAGNLRRAYHPALLYILVGLLVLANVLNIAADIAAMGAAANVLLGGNALVYMAGLTALSVVLQMKLPYRLYSRVLMALTLSLTAYVVAAFVVPVPWARALQRTVVPSFPEDSGYASMVVAILGTTISPYLFFWQASQEVEEEKADPSASPLKDAPEQAPAEFRRLRIDTIVGMLASNAIAWFIMLTTAVTLRPAGVRDIDSAAQAAKALAPIAGRFASLLFAAGVIGTGMLAVPVLAGSAAYAVGEATRRPVGLGKKPRQARAFYAVIAVATIAGLALNLASFDAMKALVLSAVVNGVVAVPTMAMMMHMATSRRVMKTFVLGRGLTVCGWAATAVMALAAIAMLVSALLR